MVKQGASLVRFWDSPVESFAVSSRVFAVLGEYLNLVGGFAEVHMNLAVFYTL